LPDDFLARVWKFPAFHEVFMVKVRTVRTRLKGECGSAERTPSFDEGSLHTCAFSISRIARRTRFSKSRRFFRSDYPQTTFAPGVSRGAMEGAWSMARVRVNTFIRGIGYG
jgi:hypothetical protein